MKQIMLPNNDLEEQLNRIINTWQQSILYMCCILLGDVDLAKDAVQETFLNVWKALPGFRGECSEKTWVVRIAINTCHSFKRGHWFRIIDRSISVDDLPEPYETPFDDDYDLLAEVVTLPQKQKEVVLLYFYQNMTVTEIASVLHISQPAVTKRLHYAESRLKKMLEDTNGWKKE